MKLNPCEYSSLSDYLIYRLRYFLDDFVYHNTAKISSTFRFLIIFGKNTNKSVLTCKILSYLFDFRSSKCVSRRHTVSKTHLGLQIASSSREWWGSTLESTCFCSSFLWAAFAFSALSFVSSCAECVSHRNASSGRDIMSMNSCWNQRNF